MHAPVLRRSMVSAPGKPALAKPRTITLTSPTIMPSQPIPREHTCEGSDASPELDLSGVPEGAAAIAIVMDDPDAPRGTWTHWTLWDVPAGTTTIPRAVKGVGIEGTTSAGEVGYHGPCPPAGTHRYFFRVFALDRTWGLPRGAPVADVWASIDKTTLAWGELMGTFTRP